MVSMTVQSKIQQQYKKSAEVAISNYFCTIHIPHTSSRCTMNEVNLQRGNRCSTTTGFMVTALPGLQWPDQATAAATGPVGLLGWHGNSCQKSIKNPKVAQLAVLS